MALIHMSRERRYAFLPEPRVEKAPDLATLISYAREHGLILRGYEAPHKTEIRLNTEFPMLLLLRGEEGLEHLVFLSARRRGRYLLLDPIMGRRVLAEKDLLALWSGYFLRIEGYEKKGGEDLPLRPSRPVPLRQRASLSLLALLPMAAMGLGFIFLDFSFPSLAVLASFLASIALSFAHKASLLRAMDRFDRRYFDGVDEKNFKRRQELYRHYHAYKKAAFATPAELVGRASCTLAIPVSLLFQDAMLAGAVGVSVTITTVSRMLLEPALRRKSLAAEAIEGRYLSALADETGRRRLRDQLRKLATGYGALLGLEEGVGVAIGVLSAVAFCLLQGRFNPQIVLFYILTCIYVGLEASRLFDASMRLEEKAKEEAYFLYNIASRCR